MPPPVRHDTEIVANTILAVEAAKASQPRLNHYVEMFDDSAIQSARLAQSRVRCGSSRALDGVVVAIKDTFAIAGRATTAGAHPDLSTESATATSPAITRLVEAGAIILGATLLDEFTLGVTGINSHYGNTLNPSDPERSPGGSSSGSATAVALGECQVALGTDTGGSVRVPASYCGVVGLKPTANTISMSGVTRLSPSLDHVGVLASDVASAFSTLDVLRGDELADGGNPAMPLTFIVPREVYKENALGEAQAFFEFVNGLDRIEVVDGLALDEAWKANATIMLYEASRVHAEKLLSNRSRISEHVLEKLEIGRSISRQEYTRARRFQVTWQALTRKLLPDNRFLLTPTTPTAAPLITECIRPAFTRSITKYTAPFNLSGDPAVSVPLTAEGLPFGLQIVGRFGNDAGLRRAAALVESSIEGTREVGEQ